MVKRESDINSSACKNNTNRIVMVSGGLASFEAARRVVERYGREDVQLWFADTLMEDEDLYRFLDDIEYSLGIPIKRMTEGRNPWQVFKDVRFIGNSRVDPCSKHLKRRFLRRKLKERFNGNNVVVYLGLDWTEPHRIEPAKGYWQLDGFDVDFPLTWEPLLFPQDYPELVLEYGIEPPRLYAYGFPHNNCGGACVKAGQKQWALLWHTFPERYQWHVDQEQKMRKILQKNVSILKDRRGGRTRPMTLRYFRWRLEDAKIRQQPDELTLYETLPDDGWACSCFATLDLEIIRKENLR